MIVTPGQAYGSWRYCHRLCKSSFWAGTAIWAGRRRCASRPAATKSPIVDNFSRRRWHARAVDRLAHADRVARASGSTPGQEVSGTRDRAVRRRHRRTASSSTAWSRRCSPDAVIHYGEQPSAPYSMNSRRHASRRSRRTSSARSTCCSRCATTCPTATSSSSARWASTARRTSTSRRASSRSTTRAARDVLPVPEAARLALPPVEGPRLAQHPLRLPRLGPARHRPEPGRRLRDRDRRDGARRAAVHALRLRRGVRHRAQPLLRPGRRSAIRSRSTARAARRAASSTSATRSSASSSR